MGAHPASVRVTHGWHTAMAAKIGSGDLQDKGKAGVITIGAAIYNADTGVLLAEQEITSFVRGAGGFGPTPKVNRVPAAVAPNEPPSRPPDAILQVSPISTPWKLTSKSTGLIFCLCEASLEMQ